MKGLTSGQSHLINLTVKTLIEISAASRYFHVKQLLYFVSS